MWKTKGLLGSLRRRTFKDGEVLVVNYCPGRNEDELAQMRRQLRRIVPKGVTIQMVPKAPEF